MTVDLSLICLMFKHHQGCVSSDHWVIAICQIYQQMVRAAGGDHSDGAQCLLRDLEVGEAGDAAPGHGLQLHSLHVDSDKTSVNYW